jgi:hypothetical protein
MRMVSLNVIANHQITPIICITFYMVIIRVGLATRANRTTSVPPGHMSTDDILSAERRRRMEVLVTTLTESKVDDDQRSLMCPTSRVRSKNPPSRIGPAGDGAVV